MKLPRNVSGARLINALRALGYETSRQTGSHIRLTAGENGVHHVTISNHNPLRVGTFAAILDDVANHFGISRQELLSKIEL